MSALRKSKKRDAIYSALSSTTSHPTAEWIYATLKPSIPALSLGTVYRNLALFKEEGRAVCVATVHGQERFDGCVKPHAHFICQHCEEVLDLDDIAIPTLEQLNVTVDRYQLNYYGLCPNCVNPSPKESKIIKGEEI